MRHRISVRMLVILAAVLLGAAWWTGKGRGVGVALAQEAAKGTAAKRPPVVVDRPPVRIIEDATPAFNGIAMDGDRAEVFVSNNNKASTPSILVYPQQFQPMPNDGVMEPLRRIAGTNARLGDICGLALSPQFKEIYTVNGDGEDLRVFPLEGNGDIAPSRMVDTDHGSGDIYLDVKNDELFITTEHVNKISVYRRSAAGTEGPLRWVQGPHTELADPHGIFADSATNEMFVTDHGNYRVTQIGEKISGHRDTVVLPIGPSTGKFVPPSIKVYSRTAQGDVPPLRVIQGSQTRLSMPLGIIRDPVSGDLVVANGGDNAVLFFDAKASGNVAPLRVLKGASTNLKLPGSVVIDAKHNELWVTNWENHLVTIFPRTAQGDVAPLRHIRSAPKEAPPASFGTPGALCWDSKRGELLVPN